MLPVGRRDCLGMGWAASDRGGVGGLWYAGKAISGPPPFQLMAAALARDYTSLLEVVDREES
jgi:hypothetical protein